MEDPEAFRALLAKLDERVELMDWHSASGFVVEHIDARSDFAQLVGPFKKDDASALTFIENLRAELNEECAVPSELHIRLLFAPDAKLSA